MLRTNYVSELSAQMDGKEVILCGWAHEVRETAKITFLILRDSTGLVQVIGKKGDVSDEIIGSMSLPKESIKDAITISTRMGITRIPVVDNRKSMHCVGLVSSTELLKEIAKASKI